MSSNRSSRLSLSISLYFGLCIWVGLALRVRQRACLLRSRFQKIACYLWGVCTKKITIFKHQVDFFPIVGKNEITSFPKIVCQMNFIYEQSLSKIRETFLIRSSVTHSLTHYPPASPAVVRSEEHTSELQSLTNIVCRLLLEKKKKHTKRQM